MSPEKILAPALKPLPSVDLFNLSWVIDEAASLAGVKQPGEDRDEFDQDIQRARAALAHLEIQAMALRALRKEASNAQAT